MAREDLQEELKELQQLLEELEAQIMPGKYHDQQDLRTEIRNVAHRIRLVEQQLRFG